MVLTAMGLLSPIGWKWHFVGMMPLALALYGHTATAARQVVGHAGRAGDRPRDGGRPTGARPVSVRGPATTEPAAGDRVVLAALAVNLTATDIVGGAAADRFELLGVVTWSTLLLTAAALWRLWRERSPDARPPAG